MRTSISVSHLISNDGSSSRLESFHKLFLQPRPILLVSIEGNDSTNGFAWKRYCYGPLYQNKQHW